jgi:hypothetical protein
MDPVHSAKKWRLSAHADSRAFRVAGLMECISAAIKGGRLCLTSHLKLTNGLHHLRNEQSKLFFFVVVVDGSFVSEQEDKSAMLQGSAFWKKETDKSKGR